VGGARKALGTEGRLNLNKVQTGEGQAFLTVSFAGCGLVRVGTTVRKSAEAVTTEAHLDCVDPTNESGLEGNGADGYEQPRMAGLDCIFAALTDLIIALC
jgi:hypothetical protein